VSRVALTFVNGHCTGLRMARFLRAGLDYQGAFRNRTPPEIESHGTAPRRELAGVFPIVRMRSAEENPPSGVGRSTPQE
jgi:hypothetical protein